LINIEPRHSYLMGDYPYCISFYHKSGVYSYKDEFSIVENDFLITNLRYNYLLYNEENPIGISGGYWDIKKCNLVSDENIEIRKYDDFHYVVTPKQKEDIWFHMEVNINGEVRRIGGVKFKVVTTEKSIADKINNAR
jgi:hypothetical protein